MSMKAAVQESLRQANNVCTAYLEDLTDAEMMARPIPGVNNLSWQLGHLIFAENWMINTCYPGSMPALPAGFKEQHGGDTAHCTHWPGSYASVGHPRQARGGSAPTIHPDRLQSRPISSMT